MQERAACTDPNDRRGYRQKYTYDKMGNIQTLQHVAGTGSFTRTFGYGTGNLLDDITVGANTYSFLYDANGNQTQENGSRYFEWGSADELRFFKTDDGGTVTVAEHYLYDSNSNRAKKYSRDQYGNVEVTVYIDGIFEHRYQKDNTGSITVENCEVHVMDDKSRVATVRVGAAFSGDTTPTVVYNLEDHLGSSMVRLGANASVVDREEYYPFGETSLRMFGKKRYRYAGKERDEHSGLYYYGARYYAPWTCRFVSVDPLFKDYPFYTPYQYAGNRPIIALDIDGLEPWMDYFDDGMGRAVVVITIVKDAYVFSENEISKFKKYYTDNYSKRYDSSGNRVVYGYNSDGDPIGYGYSDDKHHDCITSFCRATNALLGLSGQNKLNKAQVGEALKTLADKGWAEKVNHDFGFLDKDGNYIEKNSWAVPQVLSNDWGQGLLNYVTQEGYYVFGISIMSGYHSMYLTIDNTKPSEPKFILSDQLDQTQGWSREMTKEQFNDFMLTLTNSWQQGRIDNGKLHSTNTEFYIIRNEQQKAK